MTIYYSQATRGFYDDALKDRYDEAGSWPTDAVEVSVDDEAAIRYALSSGKTVSYVNSVWAFADYVPSAAELQAAAAQILSSAQGVAVLQISILTDATDPDIVDNPTAADAALLILWKKYRQALRAVDITTNPVVWPTQPTHASGTTSSSV